jgi:hypothetical protein
MIDLRSQDEVVFRQTIDLVAPDRDSHAAPREMNVGMMSLFFRQSADSVGESQCFSKIFEGKEFLKVMLVNHLPVIGQLLQQLGQSLSFQRRHSAFARDTCFFRKFTREFKPSVLNPCDNRGYTAYSPRGFFSRFFMTAAVVLSMARLSSSQMQPISTLGWQQRIDRSR